MPVAHTPMQTHVLSVLPNLHNAPLRGTNLNTITPLQDTHGFIIEHRSTKLFFWLFSVFAVCDTQIPRYPSQASLCFLDEMKRYPPVHPSTTTHVAWGLMSACLRAGHETTLMIGLDIQGLFVLLALINSSWVGQAWLCLARSMGRSTGRVQ